MGRDAASLMTNGPTPPQVTEQTFEDYHLYTPADSHHAP